MLKKGTSPSGMIVQGIVALSIMAAATVSSVAQTKLTVWGDTLRVNSYKAYDALMADIDLDIVTVAPEETVTKLQLALRAGSSIPDLVFISDAPNSAMLATRRTI